MHTALLAVLTGSTVAAITFLADRFGHKWGGLLATAPVTATIGVIYVLEKSESSHAREIILAGNYSVLASLLAIMGYFHAVKYLQKYSNNLKVAIAELVFFVIYIALILLCRFSLPIGGYLFAVEAVLIVILFKTWMRVPLAVTKGLKPLQKTPREFFIRFLTGALVFIIIKIAADRESILVGALAVFPGVFSSSLGIMGFRQSAEFSAKAAQAGVLGVAAIATFVLGYSLWIPWLSLGTALPLAGATATALTFYFLTLLVMGKLKT